MKPYSKSLSSAEYNKLENSNAFGPHVARARRRVHLDHSKTYSLINGWTAERLSHVVTLGRPSVPHTFVEWCDNHCKGKWSWWFDDDHAYIGFEKRYEAFVFKLAMPLGGSS